MGKVVACIDSSGDLRYIAMVIGKEENLESLLNDLNRSYIHMRELSKKKRMKIAERFLKSLKERREIIVLCVFVNLNKARTSLATKRTPHEKINKALHSSLASILHGLLRERNVEEVYADGEMQEILKNIGYDACNNDLVGLADVSAWVNRRYEQRKNKPHRGLFNEIDISKRLIIIAKKKMK